MGGCRTHRQGKAAQRLPTSGFTSGLPFRTAWCVLVAAATLTSAQSPQAEDGESTSRGTSRRICTRCPM